MYKRSLWWERGGTWKPACALICSYKFMSMELYVPSVRSKENDSFGQMSTRFTGSWGMLAVTSPPDILLQSRLTSCLDTWIALWSLEIGVFFGPNTNQHRYHGNRYMSQNIGTSAWFQTSVWSPTSQANPKNICQQLSRASILFCELSIERRLNISLPWASTNNRTKKWLQRSLAW